MTTASHPLVGTVSPHVIVAVPTTLWAMPFRPALPMNRAVFHRLGLSVGIAIALAGCEAKAEPTATAPPLATVRGRSMIDAEIRIFRDRETGCDYLIFDGYKQGGITARIQPNGRPYCHGNAQ